MKQGWLLIVLGLAAGIVGCGAPILGPGNAQRPVETKVQRSELDMVPNPDDGAIRQIHDAEQWRNPFVVVNRDGYELILHPDPRTTERLNLTELEEALLKLSRARWPLGRVVAVAENSLRSNGDDEEIAKGLKELKKMLESHKVRVDLERVRIFV
jgi:hypothetical protein